MGLICQMRRPEVYTGSYCTPQIVTVIVLLFTRKWLVLSQHDSYNEEMEVYRDIFVNKIKVCHIFIVSQA